MAARAADAGDAADEPAAVRAVRLQADTRQAGGGGDGLRQHAHLRRHDSGAGPRHDLRTRHRIITTHLQPPHYHPSSVHSSHTV